MYVNIHCSSLLAYIINLDYTKFSNFNSRTIVSKN